MTGWAKLARGVCVAAALCFCPLACDVPGTKVDGLVLDSKGNPIGGCDVSLYVVGQQNPVESRKTDEKSGGYSFDKLNLTGSFDIVYTHSKYNQSVVERLADQQDQHISKVLYAKGEAMPATAQSDFYLSLRRLVFLAAALDRPSRTVFLDTVGLPKEPESWAKFVSQSKDFPDSDKPNEDTKRVLSEERSEVSKLLDLIQH